MKEKIYCSKCKYYDFDRWDIQCSYHCHSNPEKKDGPIYPKIIFQDCRVKNASNDCSEFEPNLLTLIYQYWGGPKITGVEEKKGSWKKIKNYFRQKKETK